MGCAKNKKSVRKYARQNRYVIGAKISEHKFLRILQGYADGIPVQLLEPTTHVGGKTIRATYWTLRAHLPLAIGAQPEQFSGAGVYLFDNGTVTVVGRCILGRVQRTRRFAHYVRRHAPRLKSEQGEQLLLIEKTVRILCALDLRAVDIGEHTLMEIGEAFADLRVREPLQNLASKIPMARAHAHPGRLLYEDYRRYLLKHPLRAHPQTAAAPLP
ncbi:MAG: hypothetical protein KJ587_02795 [Alphaproteobacteria bacterium]|nr:hypothetical protein [Alphaproteobacteria bacterium]